MRTWLRRIRGALGMGLTWGLAWFAAGMLLLLVVGPDAADVPFPVGFGMLGFFAGATFSGVVGVVGRRRRFDELSIPKFAAWGGLGGLLFAAIFVAVVNVVEGGLGLLEPAVAFSVAGAGSAAGALALARRAQRSGELDPGDEVDDVGLTEAERRELLGGEE